MKSSALRSKISAGLLCGFIGSTSFGAVTDLANAPLITASSTTVLPNLMFVLDASGSMAWDFLPDSVGYRNGGPYQAQNCRSWSSGSESRTQCSDGSSSSRREAPYYASQYNRVFYDPTITYTPGVDPSSTIVGAAVVRPSQTNPNSVDLNSYDGGSGSIDLTTQFPDVQYCTNNSSPWGTCQKNGISGYSYPDGTYKYPRTVNGPAFYYTITPKEFCDSSSLTNCTWSTVATGSYLYPAPVRHCQTAAFATSTSVVTGNQSGMPRCQLKFDGTNYKYVRYGTFVRTEIIPGPVGNPATYLKSPGRTDCLGAVCSYQEEITNFGNWYTYYRTRMQMMKTAAGQAFIPIDTRYRVGFITINPMNGSSVDSAKYLPVDTFNFTQKTAWYNKFYSQVPSGGTPLREALSRVGRYFGGISSGINSGMTPDPMQYSCQQNFSILTTDGYWNGNAGVDLSGNSITNQDNVDGGFTTRAIGAYDPNAVPSGDNNSLADVAAYYYKTDLRPTGSNGVLGTDVSQDIVPNSATDPNIAQHMTTFTVGLVDGKMTYVSNYDTASSGDFYKIKSSSTGCSWQSSGVCNWPMPVHDTDTALDDLWHAAVNGHGKYYNASNPTTLAAGLQGVLAGVSANKAAAAAAATSSPNVTLSDNGIYSTTYRIGKWDGEVKAQQIDTHGNVSTAVQWSAGPLLDARIFSPGDNRTIYTFSASAVDKLKPFQWAGLLPAEQAYFNNKGSLLHQYGGLSSANQIVANDGEQLLLYLRGQKQLELLTAGPNGVFRSRDHVLGDAVTATSIYVKAPRFSFADAGYSTFVGANASRQAMLYVAANDGMLHAFDASTGQASSGQELWAFVPRSVFPGLYALASDDLPTNHRFFVDGSPEVMDVFIGGAWKTILVGGLNAGGRAYYALDITDPANPKGLWEFCTDASLCNVQSNNLGYSYGNAVITKNASGTWVVMVTSGYNNISPGDGIGRLFVLDAATGSILNTISTSVGSTGTPSGLAKISAWADNGDVDNTATYVYGADLLGNVYRFDMTATPMSPNPLVLATLSNASGVAQPVTTKPELGLCGTKRMVYVGTGRFLGTSDLSNTARQTVYGFKDDLATTGLGALHSSLNMVSQTITQNADGITRTISSNPVNLVSNYGWYADLISSGERVNVNPQLVLGTLLVTGNIPNSTACNVGGDSWQYQFDYCSGSYVTSAPSHTVATKMGNEMTAGFVVVSTPDGSLKQIVKGASGSDTTLGVNVGGGPGSAKKVGWREILN